LGFQFDPRRKLSYLERDLALLKIAPQQLPICTALPPLPAIPQALGCLYVMEGSTLGGQIITRHLKKHLNLGQFHYYASYGEQVGPLWKSFGEMVNSSTSDPATESLVIEGAIHTFKALQVWLEA
jgi:heme oxygenase